MLDFNKPIDFKKIKITSINVDTIYKNIDKFYEYTKHFVVNRAFKRIIDSEAFQILLDDEAFNNVDSLYTSFCIIAAGQTEIPVDVPVISKSEFMKNLRQCGYILKRTSKRINGKSTKIVEVIPSTTAYLLRERQ